MPDFFGTITLVGVQDLLNDLKGYDQAIQTRVANEIRASAQTIARNAKRLVQAPGRSGRGGTDQGQLVRLISEKQVSPLVREIISGAEYSAFREFGTKGRTRVNPAELIPIAQQFKGMKLSRGGLGFRQTIYEWARRKGIAKELWWPIFNSIRTKGSWGKPFFFPPYYAEIPILRKRLENILNKTEL